MAGIVWWTSQRREAAFSLVADGVLLEEVARRLSRRFRGCPSWQEGLSAARRSRWHRELLFSLFHC